MLRKFGHQESLTAPGRKVKAAAEAGPPEAADLLRWYDRQGRDLPWRVKGGRPDPYRAWLAEIMLQQTTVAAVIPYYARFLERWPSVAALAAAPVGDVLAAWAGLGYYRRAHNLHRCAQAVMAEHGGVFPQETAALKELPGIGDYTAAAVSAIAFDRPANVVDGNVERVMARLYEVPLPLPQAKKLLKERAAALLPAARHGDYAQALMDLGATVCTPRQPRCPECPWRAACGAYRHGTAGRFPVMAAKQAKPVRRAIAFWLLNEKNQVWLRVRPGAGLLGGMTEIPSSPWVEQPEMPDLADVTGFAPKTVQWTPWPAQIRHSFTHFDLYIQIVYAKENVGLENGFWAGLDDLRHLALPSVMRKIAAAMMERGETNEGVVPGVDGCRSAGANRAGAG